MQVHVCDWDRYRQVPRGNVVLYGVVVAESILSSYIADDDDDDDNDGALLFQ